MLILNILYRLKTCVRYAKSISFPEHENCNNIVSCYANNNKHNNHVEIRITLTGVYSSTNWTPPTGGQNSILNWVLKLNPLNQKSQSLPLFSYGVCLFIAARIIFLKHRPWTQNASPPPLAKGKGALGTKFRKLRGDLTSTRVLNSQRGRAELNSQSELDSGGLLCFSATMLFLWQHFYKLFI